MKKLMLSRVNLLLAIALLAAPAVLLSRPASGQQAPSWYDPEQRGAKVMSHVPMDTSHFKDVLFRENEGRSYLYIQSSGSREVAVWDVTSRRKPKAAGSIDLPVDAKLSGIVFKGDIAIVPAAADSRPSVLAPAAAPNNATEDIAIWDFSQPGKPRLSQKFTGVKKVISARGNVEYIFDSRGLWIVQIYNQEMRDWDYYVDHISE